jgi:hypothetical protein
MIGKRLASDGLLLTTVQAIEILGPRKFLDDEAAGVKMLLDAGLPVDLLASFRAVDERETASVIGYFAKLLDGGRTAASIGPELDLFQFDFQPTRPGFRLQSEAGNQAIDAIRLQMTRGSYWEAPGDGGNLDLVRQLVEVLPDVEFVISIEERFLEEFLSQVQSWSGAAHASITMIPQEVVVSQWAQDNGKAMVNAAGVAAIIVPRFASRGEDGSTFVPGETFLADGLKAAGLDVYQSPLLFQGGDVMAVGDPATKSGKLIGLIGEADVYRNVALGLTEAQAIDALRIEFGLDRLIKLPAVSFHIDFEVTVRAKDGKLIAFVNDTDVAMRLIFACAIDKLRAIGELDDATTTAAMEHLRNGRRNELLQLVGEVVWRHADASGHLPLSFAERFSSGPGDSGVGNLQRLLLALDWLVSQVADLQMVNQQMDRHAAAYIESFKKMEEDRDALVQTLLANGFEVVKVPSVSMGDRGINYINGIQDRSRYLMPAYGGMFAPLDAAARRTFEQALGPNISVIPIYSAETQRRHGGVHCSAGAIYGP